MNRRPGSGYSILIIGNWGNYRGGENRRIDSTYFTTVKVGTEKEGRW
ncbi:MAG: hypothetical protein WC560_08240 [Syntrophales bacterium]